MTDWTPSQLPNTIPGWWDAADASTITESGGAVSSWASKVGAITADQATGSKQPTYSATGRNSLPSVQFDGTDDVLIMSAMTDFATGTDESHIFAVGVFTDAGNTGYKAIASVGDRTTDAWPSGTRYSVRELAVDPSENAGVDVWYDGTYSTSTWLNTDRIVHGQVGGDKAYGIRIDGAAAQASRQNQLLSIATHGALGAAAAPTPSDFWTGHLQEVIFINGALAKEDRERIEGYLAHKWGLSASLPSGHPYKSAAPTVEAVKTVVFLKVGDTSPWTVPSDWNDSDNTIEVIGAGGDGFNNGSGQRDAGGGGGYSSISNHNLTPGGTVAFQVGAGGSGNTTWFDTTGTVLANPGANGTAGGGGAGGAAGTGTVTYAGGNGGGSTSNGGGGGGGAAGPDGAGAAGASSTSNTSVGGGGANGGSAGSSTSGGAGVYGSTDLPGSGAGGDASGGTTAGVAADNGYQQDYWRETATDEVAGPGGGGGGARGATTGGNGGGYGGGGGGGSNESQGADGIIVITYTPVSSVSGTASITDADDTVSASGTSTVEGAAAITDADDTVDATGTQQVSGAAAIGDGDDVVAATGTQTIGGEATIADGDDTVSASGTQTIGGEATITDADDTVDASGTHGSGVTGAADITDGDDTAAAEGLAGPLWTPADLAVAPVVWIESLFDADLTLAGSDVSNWANRGSGGDFTDVDAGARLPAFVPAAINGRPAVRGDGTKRLRATAVFTSAGHATFFAGSIDGTPNNGRGYSIGGATNDWNNIAYAALFMKPATSDWRTDRNYGATAAVDTVAITEDTPLLLTKMFSADGLGTGTKRLNGLQAVQSTRAGWAGAFNTTHAGLFARADSTFADGGSWTAAAVISLDYEPTDDERDRIEGYLAHRYGLTLDAGHTYATSPPLKVVSGAAAIGDADDTVAATGTSGSDVLGTADITDADDSVTAAGTTPVVGEAAIGDGDDTVSASGTQTIGGEATIGDGDDTVAAEGTVGDSPAPEPTPTGGGGNGKPRPRRRWPRPLYEHEIEERKERRRRAREARKWALAEAAKAAREAAEPPPEPAPPPPIFPTVEPSEVEPYVADGGAGFAEAIGAMRERQAREAALAAAILDDEEALLVLLD